MNAPSILIAGIGNIFHGDDGFGVAVAQALMQRELPPAVRS
jgi:hydrogenase maturation protease